MKYCCWRFLALIALLPTNVYALQPKIEIFEQFDDLRVVAFIDAQEIKQSPEWVPSVSAPPLTVLQAIRAVKSFRKTSSVSPLIKEIEIRPVPKHEKQWHYLIKISNSRVTTGYDIYVVLMSGAVIPAIIEPQAYK